MFCIFVILVIFRFWERGLVFDAPVPGHCLLVTLKIETEMSKYINCTKLSSLQKASSDCYLPIIVMFSAYLSIFTIKCRIETLAIDLPL